jgi:hypothetical protein
VVEGGNGCASSSGSPGASRGTYRLPNPPGVHGIRNPLFFPPAEPSSLGANKGWDGPSGELRTNMGSIERDSVKMTATF